MFKMRVYFGSEDGFREFRIYKFKRGIFWEGGVDYGNVAYSGSEGCIFWSDG